MIHLSKNWTFFPTYSRNYLALYDTLYSHCQQKPRSISILALRDNIQESGMNFRILKLSLNWNTELPPFWRSPSRELKNSLEKKKRLILERRGELLDNVDAPRELHEWIFRKVRATD